MKNETKSPVNLYLQKARALKKEEDRAEVIERSAFAAKVLAYAAGGAVALFLIGKILRLAGCAVTDTKAFLNCFKK